MDIRQLIRPDRWVLLLAAIMAAPLVYQVATVEVASRCVLMVEGGECYVTQMYEQRPAVFAAFAVVVAVVSYVLSAVSVRVIYPRLRPH